MDQATMQKLVNRLGHDCFEAHRGAFWWDEGRRVAVAFGNDGFGGEDGRARFEVESLRELLRREGGKELAFATGDDGYTWALACALPGGLTPDVLEGVLWMAWNLASSGSRPGRPNPERVVLDWDAVREGLRDRKFGSALGALTGYQANAARAFLERNGLV
jgi:hypothetical protein